MSAPHAGRQSPDPERQSGAQGQDTPAGSGKVDAQKGESGGNDGGAGQTVGDQNTTGQTEGLSSNPTHPLEGEAEKKTSKE